MSASRNCSGSSTRRPCSRRQPGSSCDEPELTGIPVKHLFKGGRTLATLLLWVVFFMSLLDLYFLSNWLPTVLNDLGASVSQAVAIGSMLQVGGVVGTFALGSIIDRFSFRALALVYFIAVFAVGAIGQLGHSVTFVTMAIFAAGFCIVGGQIAANALAAGLYPTSVRATGRRLGARDRPGRLDRRTAGRRRAADHEMECGSRCSWPPRSPPCARQWRRFP